jgi:serine protease Do
VSSVRKVPGFFWPLVAVLWLCALGLGVLALKARLPVGGEAEVQRLTTEISARGQLLQKAGCTADGTPAALPEMPVPATAPAPAASPAPAATPAKGDRTALTTPELLRKIERATVLVLSDVGSGSGFYVTPELIITNHHVVGEGEVGEVNITSKVLGQVHPGRVIKVSAGSEFGSPDFALIRMGPDARGEPLPLSRSVTKLLKVVAAGYPGLAIGNDLAFQRLMKGDLTAAPDLNLTDGTVSATQKSSKGLQQILHSAAVLGGNSGGPLVDLCGRVVGVNTFIAVDQEQSGRLNYALSSGDIATFLSSTAAGAQTDDTVCN